MNNRQPESLNSLLEKVAEYIQTIQSGFDAYQNECFDKRLPQFFCLELNGEAGELANLEKKSWKGKDVPFDRFEDEAADVMIALLNYSNSKGIELGKAVYNKLVRIENKRALLESKGEKY
ncbi:MAG: hypothetical protein KIT33_01320 [Candidatus Kapabacteria bacterium]|nr:hypothetical protein [Ignavibacteriota bacterium]MCW5883589.1 hypothetical protein [Candidatus Kapabacteria bacterium]